MARETTKSRLLVRQGHYASPLPSLGLQHAWYETVRGSEGKWQSLALVPVDDDTWAIDAAHGFARMAAEDPTCRVLMVNAQVSACAPSQRSVPPTLEEVWAAWASVASTSAPPVGGGPYDFIDLSTLRADEAKMLLSLAPQLVERLRAGQVMQGSAESSQAPGSDGGNETSGRFGRASILFAVDSVLVHTGAIPLARAVDKVVACITMGKTRVEDIKRAAQIVGTDKVLGVVALNP